MHQENWVAADYVFFYCLITGLLFEITYDLDDWHAGVVPMIILHKMLQACQKSLKEDNEKSTHVRRS